MLPNDYFHRVHALTPTRFWVNNPTRRQARLALEAGTVGCTTNPTHAIKMVRSADDGELARSIISETIAAGAHSATEAAVLVQRRLVQVLLAEFANRYAETNGRFGFVSIQGDPHAEMDPDNIIREALADMQLGANAIAKIPVTEAGLTAIGDLVGRNVPIIATEIMSMAQMIAVCEAYQAASRRTMQQPAFFVTHITGIFDDHLKHLAAAGQINVSPDSLFQAGTLAARKQLRLMQEREYPGIMLGGGARGLHHFTEMVGGAMHVTINWEGTADKLIEQNPPVIKRMQLPADDAVLDELLTQVPDFARAYYIDGLQPAEFADFGPVELFRSQFLKGWDDLLEVIGQQMNQ